MFWSLTAWEVLSKALPHNDKDALNFLFEGLGRISCIAPKSERSGSVQKKNSGGRCNEHIPNMHSLDTHKRRSVAICRGSTECRHRHHGTQWRETKRKHTVGGEFKYTKAIENWIKKGCAVDEYGEQPYWTKNIYDLNYLLLEFGESVRLFADMVDSIFSVSAVRPR